MKTAHILARRARLKDGSSDAPVFDQKFQPFPVEAESQRPAPQSSRENPKNASVTKKRKAKRARR